MAAILTALAFAVVIALLLSRGAGIALTDQTSLTDIVDSLLPQIGRAHV